MPVPRSRLWLVLCAAAACGGVGNSDGGSVLDGGAPAVEDAGARSPDGGVQPDSGVLDAGASDDAGLAVDAGAPDSGAADAGLGVDRDPLADAGNVVKVDGGFSFTEGPLWVASQGVLLFSDLVGERLWQYTPPGHASFRSLRQNAGRGNGLGMTDAGEVLICEGPGRRVLRMHVDGGVSVFVDQTPDGGRLESPNDLVIRSDGTVYFSDYGASRPAVYRVDPSGRIALVSNSLQRPNGVALSPDERTLFVADLPADQVWAYPVNPDGSVGAARLFARTTVGGGGGGADGLCIDDDGNLYVATVPGLKVFRPDGGFRRTLVFAEEPSNCSFGDADRRTLYVTARTGLYRMRLGVPGLP